MKEEKSSEYFAKHDVRSGKRNEAIWIMLTAIVSVLAIAAQLSPK